MKLDICAGLALDHADGQTTARLERQHHQVLAPAGGVVQRRIRWDTRRQKQVHLLQVFVPLDALQAGVQQLRIVATGFAKVAMYFHVVRYLGLVLALDVECHSI